LEIELETRQNNLENHTEKSPNSDLKSSENLKNSPQLSDKTVQNSQTLENQNKNHKIQIRVQDCFRITPQKPTQKGNWSQEIKILDTWFSSTLWPLSTLDFVEFTHKEKQKTEIDSEIETLQKLLAKI